jgi:hypothetical protein
MVMTRSAAGAMACSCAAGFLQLGDARVGPQSCSPAAQAQPFFNNEKRE